MRTVKVIILARDEIVGAFPREQIGAIPMIKVVGSDSAVPQGMVVDAGLMTFSKRRVLRASRNHDRTDEVAHRLCLTRDTVKKHLQHICAKLKVRSII